MLDLETTKKISCGYLTQFTFLLREKHALNGYITCSYLAKNKKEALMKMQCDRSHRFSLKNGDQLVKTS